jgi:hypothetical protein
MVRTGPRCLPACSSQPSSMCPVSQRRWQEHDRQGDQHEPRGGVAAQVQQLAPEHGCRVADRVPRLPRVRARKTSSRSGMCTERDSTSTSARSRRSSRSRTDRPPPSLGTCSARSSSSRVDCSRTCAGVERPDRRTEGGCARPGRALELRWAALGDHLPVVKHADAVGGDAGGPAAVLAGQAIAAKPLTRSPTPASHMMCQKPATTPTNASSCAIDWVTRTERESVTRRRKLSRWLTRTRAASSGIAAEKAMTQTFVDQSRAVAVRNGCTRTKPIAIAPGRSGCSAGSTSAAAPAPAPPAAAPGRPPRGHHSRAGRVTPVAGVVCHRSTVRGAGPVPRADQAVECDRSDVDAGMA